MSYGMSVDEEKTEKTSSLCRNPLFCPCLIAEEPEAVPEAMMKRSRFFLGLFLFCSCYLVETRGFTRTYGINYGRIADNLPSPSKVVQLLRQSKIRNVRIFDSDHTVLQAFSGSGLDLVIGLPNSNLKEINSSSDRALTWVKENIESFLPRTRIVGVAIGNEVLGGGDTELYGALLGAAKNIHGALEKLGLENRIQITTAHSQAVFVNSYPPSSCRFSDNVKDFMNPLLEFFVSMKSSFCLNAYPFLAYMGDPDHIDMNYALFQSNDGTVKI